MKRVSAKEIKLISDIVWGFDMGKLDWTWSLWQWRLFIFLYRDFIVPIYETEKNVAGKDVDMLIGYFSVFNVNVFSEQELVKKERELCKYKMIRRKKTGFVYLAEIILHSKYRGTSGFFKMAMLLLEYLERNNIDVAYTTAVSDYSRRLMRNKYIASCVELLAVKEEEREVYKIDVLKLLRLRRRFVNERSILYEND